MRHYSVFIIWAISLLTTGCSAMRNNPPQVVQSTVVRISAEYLGALATTNEKKLENLVLWKPYLDENNQLLLNEKKGLFFQKLRTVSKSWKKNNHPLLGLDVKNIDIDKDTATIDFEKVEGAPNQIISVRLLWIGAGWMVVDDNLFGEKERFSILTHNQ